MNEDKVNMYKRAIAREKAARKEAERILEEKSRELYFKSKELEVSNKKLEELVQEKTSELKGVFENIVDAYVVMDISGNVLKMNDAAENLLGYGINDKINLLSLVVPEEHERLAVSFQQLYENGSITDFNIKISIANGSIRLVHVNASMIYNSDQRPIAAQGIVRDITELRSLELQKQNLLKKLEKSNDELQEYAHVVSHDLKSPLRSINALISWIKDDNEGELSSDTLTNFDMIEATLEKMEQLISDVLEYSSIVGDANTLSDVDLNNVMDDIITLLHFPEHIHCTVIKPLPTIRVDRVKIQQLFQNLISNAVNYSDKGKGLIEIDFEEGDNAFTFSVKDNGIGIDKEYHQKIFQIFQSLNKREESTGIGLSIVKKIVDLYNGRIWLESTLGKGTTFFFTIEK